MAAFIAAPVARAGAQLQASAPSAVASTHLLSDSPVGGLETSSSQGCRWLVAVPLAGLLAGHAKRRRGKVQPTRVTAVAATASAPTAVTTPAVLENLPCTRGVLPNGLRYLVLQHAVPAGRVEAHLEFHVGSVDEEENQRGMAHMLEHICFLGSSRRTELQSKGIGMTSNALTDFQHTVYHLNLDIAHLAAGLDVLVDVGFTPAFASERVEKERAAVLSEAQVVNNVHYRLQQQMLGAIHEENPIHSRFPIGIETQIASWTRDELRSFHSRWYRPENATLYIVGDAPEDTMVAEVERVFGKVPGSTVAEDPWRVDTASIFRPPMPARPAVLHDFIDLGGGSDEALPEVHRWTSELKVSVASNELLQGMQICWAAKSPLRATQSPEDLLPWLCDRLVVEVVRLRLQTRWCMNEVPCNFHAYDTTREGVNLTTLTVMTEPSRWSDTCTEVLQEIHAVTRYGIVAEELDLTLRLMLDKVAEVASSQPWAFMGTMYGYNAAATSREVAEALIASHPAGHLFTRADRFSEALQSTSKKVSLEMLNAAAGTLLRPFGGEHSASGAVVVSCPATIQDHLGRRAAYQLPAVDDVRAVLLNVPELAEEEVRSRLVSVPASLLPALEPVAPLERRVSPGGEVALQLPNGLNVRLLVRQGAPDGPTQSTMRLTAPGGRAADALSGNFGSLEAGLVTVQSSGVGEWSREQVQLHQQLNSVGVELRPGAHVAEVDVHFAPSASSCRAALEWLHWLLREPQLDLKAFNKAQLRLKGSANFCEKSLEGRAQQALLQQMYPRDMWLWQPTLDQANRLTLGQAKKAVLAQLGGLSNLRLDIAGTAAAGGSLQGTSGVSGLSHEEGEEGGAAGSDPGEGSAAPASAAAEGAIEELQNVLEREVCSILGSLPASSGVEQPPPSPCMASQGCELRVHVPDAEERAYVLVGGGAPGYWGQGDATWEAETGRRGFSWAGGFPWLGGDTHVLLPAIAMNVMLECMNGRLIGRVRDQLSLTYSCSMELTMFDGFSGGHFICRAFASPDRLAPAANAVLQVLRSPDRLPFLDREVEAAKRVLAYREARDRRERGYLVGKMRPLPGGEGAATPEEERRVLEGITAADVQRAWEALTGLEDPFVVLATAGANWVPSVLPPGPVVSRNRAPVMSTADAVATPQGGASLNMLD